MTRDLGSLVRRRASALAHPVVAVGLGMITLHIAVRAWALFPSWFYTDDYRLLYDATHSSLDLDYLLRPFDSQFMPLGRALVWLVAHSGVLNWPLAATITLGLQTVAALSCLWMLAVVFRTRWSILAPLALYLTTALPIPALMWWAAAVNQIPMQIAFFVAIGAWVKYLRQPRAVLLWAAVAAVSFGLLCYVKALLIAPTMVFIAYAYFSSGTPLHRLRSLLRRFWLALVVGGALLITYVVAYRLRVPQPFNVVDSAKVREVAESMLGTTIPTGLVGGPWRWWDTTPPIVLVQPPLWGVAIAYALIAAVAAYALLQRRNALPGLVLLCAYASILFVLLATSRGQLYGGLAGLELRYVTDLAPVLALSVGLTYIAIPGATQSSMERAEPYLRLMMPTVGTCVLVGVVGLGGVLSTTRYVSFWHHDNRGKDYVPAMRRSLDAQAQVPHLATQVMPSDVMPEYTKPLNQTDEFVKLLSTPVEFPQATDRLQVFDQSGTLQPAIIENGVASLPGPNGDCGWKAKGQRLVNIPLEDKTFEWQWWIRIGYLASDDSTVRVKIGKTTVTSEVKQGLHSLFVRATGAFDHVTISGLADGVTICVDAVQVGEPVPGAPL